MKKTNKLYKKAEKLYNEGYIDKAIQSCEKSILADIRNSGALNLKGLLWYLKGDLNEARRIWEINYKANNDQVSKKYLNDSKKDNYNKEVFEEAVKLVNKIEINDALKYLEQCRNSHYNIINVNNYLSVCYIKKGEYQKAISCIEEVKKVDKKNKTAYDNEKLLIQLGIVKKDLNKKVIKTCITAILLVVVIYSAVSGMNYIKHKKYNYSKGSNINVEESTKSNKEIKDKKIEKQDKENNINKVENKVEDKTEKNIQEKVEDNKVHFENNEEFPFNEIQTSIENKNIEMLYDYIEKWDNKELHINEKALINKAKDIMEQLSGTFYYEKGYSQYKEENYTQAVSGFDKGVKYGKKDYIYENSLYLLAVSYKKTDDVKNSLKYYERFIEEFLQDERKDSDYIDDVLYELALLYKNIDLKKSIEYAQTLVNNYPDSDYNNSNIKEILK